jgi:alpha-tubulin suppressor-like RCC1 family protein
MKQTIEDGRLYLWGSNKSKSLGVGLSGAVEIPTLVDKLVGVTIQNVVCGDKFTIALSNEGIVYSWVRIFYSIRMKEQFQSLNLQNKHLLIYKFVNFVNNNNNYNNYNNYNNNNNYNIYFIIIRDTGDMVF